MHNFSGMSDSRSDQDMLFSAKVGDSTNSHTHSSTEDFKWNRDSVILLISLYQSNKSQFVSGFVKKRDLWSQVASEMSTHGFMVNLIGCEKKWHNLCATYRRLKDCGMKKRTSWPYFQLLQGLLEENSSTQNTNLNSDCSMQTDSNCNMVKVESSNPGSTHNYNFGPWIPPYQSQIRNSPSEIEGGSCDRDISNMLSVTMEENLDRSQPSRDQIHIPPSFVNRNHDDFKWTHDSVMLLCSLYLMRKEQFLSGTVKKRDLWTDIAQEMCREGFSVTFVACEKKWHNLIATYKKVSMYSRKKTWPYLRFFQKIIEEQMLHAASYNFSEPSHLGNGFHKEFSDHSIDQRQFDKERDPHGNSATLYGEPHKNFEDFKWTHASVISLCTLYKERRREFLSNAVRKRDLWLDIAGEMSSLGYRVSWVHCEKKWYNLYATYKKVIDQNRKRTRIWSTWPYLKLFQDIFDPSKEGENDHPESFHIQKNPFDSNPTYNIPSPLSDHSAEATADCMCHSTKKQCTGYTANWFSEYCKHQEALEEKRRDESERRHKELLDAINAGNTALLELNSSLKTILNKEGI